MQIVYAIGSPRLLEFEITDARGAVPTDATVFAICTGDRTMENQDEDLFAAITDEEYFTLRAMVNEAERLEAETEGRAERTSWKALRSFIQWLFNRNSNGQSGRATASSTKSSATLRRREIIPMRLN